MLRREDNVSFALPFMAGMIITSIMMGKFCDSYESILNSAILSSILIFISIISTFFLLVKRSKSYKIIEYSWLSLIVIMFFFSGANSYVISELVGSWDGFSSLDREKSKMAINIANHISQIPYKNEESKHIISALLVGDKGNLAPQTISYFRESGAAHILALSGLHLGLIYGVLKFISKILGGRPIIKKTSSILIILFAGLYTHWTGASPSLIRAFLFIGLREIANILNRDSKNIDIYCTALTIQLVLNPQIIHSIGFQLSYLACAGIYFVYPYVKDWYVLPFRAILKSENDSITSSSWSEPMRKIWELIALSTVCQLFTLPATWHYFGSFPKYFIITNLIAIPLSSFILISSMLIVAIGYLDFYPSVLIIINEAMIEALCFCLKIISELP